MTAALAVVGAPGAMALRPASLDDAIKLAERLAGNPTLPGEFQKPNAILLVILKASDLGLSVAQAFEGLHVIKGRIVMSSAMACGLVIRDPLCESFECTEETPERVAYQARRAGSKRVVEGSFTLAEAKAAGLIKPESNWAKFPMDMLHARARARCARRGFPDLLLGMPPMREDVEDGAIDLVDNGGKWEAPPPAAAPPSAPRPQAPQPTAAKPAPAAKPAAAPPATSKPIVDTTATPVGPAASKPAPAPASTPAPAPSVYPSTGSPVLDDIMTALRGKIERAPTLADLKMLVPEIQALPTAQRDELRIPYKAQAELLERMAKAPKTTANTTTRAAAPPPPAEAPRPVWGEPGYEEAEPADGAPPPVEREVGSDDEDPGVAP